MPPLQLHVHSNHQLPPNRLILLLSKARKLLQTSQKLKTFLLHLHNNTIVNKHNPDICNYFIGD